ncbi:flagellar biosynthetic protein FliO [Cryobacterium sp. PAMC25264]|uniref:flagellar biosynthetic protein FliO n=1 Tax=Cryobacterium sp. PAMC25264 TaxID=2861288 RepID=UPI001C632FAC|nr:flagellar biosynthetic protein FliO [Cryobacterium sp. PAMC25264]QYF74674.1 flagellar biosynthetic protein FliO [Cryobacterium sp. PAMC25264]
MDTVVVALRVVLSLAVVLGLLWVLQRRLSRGPGTRTANVVTVVGRQGLGQKVSVVVVDVDGRRFVLGVTEQSVTVLHGGEAEPEANRAEHQTSDDRSAAFARSLHAASGGPTLVPPVLVPLRVEEPVASATAGLSADPPLTFRPRRDRSSTGRLGGSILSPSTWQQTAALLRHGR